MARNINLEVGINFKRIESRLKSRKLWMGVLGAVLPILTQLSTGEVGWDKAVALSVSAVAIYIFSQGWQDVHRERTLVEMMKAAQDGAPKGVDEPTDPGTDSRAGGE